MVLLKSWGILLLVFLSGSTFAQTKLDTGGIIRGFVRDSIYEHVLKSATVSVYNTSDNKLISFQITNNFGEFYFNNLPLANEIRVVISNIGYQQVTRVVKFSKSSKIIDFKTIFINQKITTLNEVTITVPPVQMNGDTLEFNTAAFKLDSNAVVQDFMKKIPNITMWGNGTITVNGREIKSLLVNGKEFMGGDPKISIENIPKNALEKIQVYNTIDNPKNKQDSALFMNLKLKKGKEIGYFGKLGGGYGSNSRFESDVSLNFYSPKVQVSLVGASNNVNKVVNNVNTLLKNSTFKGVGVDLDYMSDFRTTGINRPRSLGYTFKYDLLDKVTKTQNRNLITNDYFIQNNQIQQQSFNKTTTSTNSILKIEDENKNNGFSNNVNQKFNAGYEFSKDRYSFKIVQNVDLNRIDLDNNSSTISSNGNGQIVSSNEVENHNSGNNNSYGVQTGMSYKPNLWDIDSRFSGFDFDYSWNINDNQNLRTTYSDFTSSDSTKSKILNRQYDSKYQSVSHHINFSVFKILKLITGPKNFKIFDIDMKNDIKIFNKTGNYNVDEIITNSQLKQNDYLTTNFNYKSIIYEPELNINKSITKSLTNRFSKTFVFSVALKARINTQVNESNKDFQNIDNLYKNLTPSVSVSYSDDEYGEFRKSLSANFNTVVKIPGIDQLAPLTDSINVYYIKIPNLKLREEKTRSFNLSYKYVSEKKNNFEYQVTGNYKQTEDDIVDNVVLDNQNLRTISSINNSNNFIYGLSGNIKKAFKMKSNEVQLNFNSSYNYSKTPNFINNIERAWYANYFYNALKINYTYKTNFVIEAKQEIANSLNQEQQSVDNSDNRFRYTNLSSSLSMSIGVTKKLKLNSNISLSKNKSTGFKDINYNIWNATTAYRFLKGNTLEIKISALDILRQNTSIINQNRGGIIIVGSQNVLQHYFILGLSYYPRKFGIGKKSK